MPDRIGAYRIEELLGCGGMGEVYGAYDEKLQRRVAIKLIRGNAVRAEALKRFLQEARTAARLSHPSIVQIYHVEEVAGDECIVMELIDGRPLSRLVRQGPLASGQCLSLARQIAAGLAEAHAKNVVHRDLKTENVMVTADGRAKILDFGLAKPLAELSDSHSGYMLAGTPRAMSPEQANELPADPRSDLFSFGTLLYEIATGQSPFRGRTPIAVLHQVCHHQPPAARELNPQVPAQLSVLIGHLLQKNPNDRPQSAREVLERLEQMPDAPEAATLTLPPVVHDERRQITLLVCTLRPEREAGPEDSLSILAPGFLNGASEIIQRHLGAVKKITSQGLVACFGYPQAHEDDACRAVRAALATVERFRNDRQLTPLDPPRGTPQGRQPRLQLRVGLHTGDVEVPRRGIRRPELLPAEGDPWDLAARLDRAVEPGSVWLSSTTHRLVRDSFLCQGPHRLPGLETPLYRVSGRVERRGAYRGSGLSSLVARREELELLEERWKLAQEGRGQVVLVSGDVGLGKSRLMAALAAHLGLAAPAWWACRSMPELQDKAWQPVIALLWQVLAIDREMSPLARRARLEELLEGYGLASRLPPLAALLGLPLAAAERPQRRDLHRLTIEAVLELLLAATAERPRVWLVEDLHWTDPSTLELLDLLIDRLPTSRLLLLLTFRPRFKPPWNPRAYLTTLVLGALNTSQVKDLIGLRTHGKALPQELVQQIVAQTDGVPFFVEELVRYALESDMLRERNGRYELRSGERRLSVPTTLRDTLTARLDRLGHGKPIAQLASVFGREVPAELLRAVAPFDDDTLQRELDRLVRAELLYRQGISEVKYVFRHALIQRVAYESLAEAKRREYHAEIARVLRTRFPGTATMHPELLAHHFAEAEEPVT